MAMIGMSGRLASSHATCCSSHGLGNDGVAAPRMTALARAISLGRSDFSTSRTLTTSNSWRKVASHELMQPSRSSRRSATIRSAGCVAVVLAFKFDLRLRDKLVTNVKVAMRPRERERALDSIQERWNYPDERPCHECAASLTGGIMGSRIRFPITRGARTDHRKLTVPR